jgi:hypothetical protein
MSVVASAQLNWKRGTLTKVEGSVQFTSNQFSSHALLTLTSLVHLVWNRENFSDFFYKRGSLKWGKSVVSYPFLKVFSD